MSTGQTYNVDRLGIFTPKQEDTTILECGEVGWVVCAIKDILGAPVGDTLTLQHNPATEVLPGFKKVKPQVYAGLFPVSSDDYEAFRDALGKLSLMMPHFSMSQKILPHLVLVSVVVSLAFYIWKSFKSV